MSGCIYQFLEGQVSMIVDHSRFWIWKKESGVDEE
jgi:hypothetical protein